MKTPEMLFVLDLDRTMANARLYDEAESVLEEILGTGYDTLKQVRQKTESEGGSFDFISYLTAHGGPVQDFLRQFAQRAEKIGYEAFRNEGATQLLQRLAKKEIPYIFMTYGGEMWQRAKLAAAGYDTIPTIITSSKQKGYVIATWQDETGQFAVDVPGGATVSVAHVVLVDDKAAAFDGLPATASGYLLQELSVDQLVSQAGELSPYVKTVRSLTEVYAH